jgi:hypothetical protein
VSVERETIFETRQQASERLLKLAEKILAYSQKYETVRDERAVFAFMYSKMTADLANFLKDSDITLDDPEWITMLAEAFAMRFIKAMDAIDAWLQKTKSDELKNREENIYEMVPKPWADVYLAIHNGQSYVLEDMVFSMMAHISYDLPLALLQVKMETNGQSHVRDYHQMNQVLASRIDEMQKEVAQRYNRLLIFLDRFAGYHDEFFTNYGIRLARSVAWYNAHRISDPLSEQDANESIERSTEAFIKSIRTPKIRMLRYFVLIARFLIPPRRKWPEPIM